MMRGSGSLSEIAIELNNSFRFDINPYQPVIGGCDGISTSFFGGGPKYAAAGDLKSPGG